MQSAIKEFPPLEAVSRPTVPTDQAAHYLLRQPQTLRYWAVTGVQNTPLNYLTQFSNLADTAGRGGQTAQITSSGGGSSPLASALGGAQLGRAAQQWWNGNGSSGSTWSGINQSAWDNGYGNTFQQNGNSPDISYG